MSDEMRIAPITVKAARQRVREWHRHLPDVQGGLFAAQILDGEECVGVAIAGNPPRVWQGTGRIVISRVATPGARNACSMLYGATWRAVRALGYCRLITYTLPEEGGASLRGAGFTCLGIAGGGTWDRRERPRVDLHPTQHKLRWERSA